MIMIGLREAGRARRHSQPLTLGEWLRWQGNLTKRSLRRQMIGLPLGAMLLMSAALMLPMALVFLQDAFMPAALRDPVSFIGFRSGFWRPWSTSAGGYLPAGSS
jgi:hypothetical protein